MCGLGHSLDLVVLASTSALALAFWPHLTSLGNAHPPTPSILLGLSRPHLTVTQLNPTLTLT